MVRGKEISFAPQDIKRVLRLRRDPLPNAASYEERVANKDYRLDHVQEDLCIEGGEWVRHKDDELGIQPSLSKHNCISLCGSKSADAANLFATIRQVNRIK
ncbi:hypothetical protein PIB30_081498 [Stylosanthes scabra]|uniref:Uncharacterized protein n=1 Tax=Stylosanthes scabra TaxID=79078 RepID=A0ABU6YPB8_9FABA|nr:hypothetical protein [Stylosanthes scabra]